MTSHLRHYKVMRVPSLFSLMMVVSIPLMISCSVSHVQPAASNAFKEKERLYSDPGLPFDLSILEEVNDGESLHILARIAPKANWPADSVAVILKGMEKGIVKDFDFFVPEKSSVRSGEGIVGMGIQQLPRGEPIEFSLKIKSEGLSDYQLELLWGSDAREYLEFVRGTSKGKADVVAPAVKNVNIYRERIPCEGGRCYSKLTLFGDLYNGTENVLNEVVLGVGYLWSESNRAVGSQIGIPGEEQELVIKDLNLAPGLSRPLKIELDSLIPDSEQGSYKPVLRIVRYN